MISRSQAQASGLIELTYPSDPDDTIETIHGRLTIHEWCLSERIRLELGGRKAQVVIHNGLVSVWTNPVAVSLKMVN